MTCSFEQLMRLAPSSREALVMGDTRVEPAAGLFHGLDRLPKS